MARTKPVPVVDTSVARSVLATLSRSRRTRARPKLARRPLLLATRKGRAIICMGLLCLAKRVDKILFASRFANVSIVNAIVVRRNLLGRKYAANATIPVASAVLENRTNQQKLQLAITINLTLMEVTTSRYSLHRPVGPIRDPVVVSAGLATTVTLSSWRRRKTALGVAYTEMKWAKETHQKRQRPSTSLLKKSFNDSTIV